MLADDDWIENAIRLDALHQIVVEVVPVDARVDWVIDDLRQRQVLLDQHVFL
jgi:hypothetical protein